MRSRDNPRMPPGPCLRPPLRAYPLTPGRGALSLASDREIQPEVSFAAVAQRPGRGIYAPPLFRCNAATSLRQPFAICCPFQACASVIPSADFWRRLGVSAT